jgi:hypothetical protein
MVVDHLFLAKLDRLTKDLYRQKSLLLPLKI